MKKLILSFSIAIFLAILSQSIAIAQEEKTVSPDANLNERFKHLKESSETFKAFKVIKNSELNKFWKINTDSLNALEAQLNTVTTSFNNEKGKTADLSASLAKTQKDLEESLYQGDHMSLLGMDMQKSSYAATMWTIVAALLAVIGLLFTRLRYSIGIEKKTMKNFQEVTEELRESKTVSLEKEMKLKRELQTAVNSLNEMKGKGGSRF